MSEFFYCTKQARANVIPSKRNWLLLLLLSGMIQTVWAAKFMEMKVLDKDYLMLHFKDGIVEFVDDGQGPYAYHGSHTEPGYSDAVYYGEPLSLNDAADTGNWIIRSGDDANYSGAGLSPVHVYRKSRVNGMSMEYWGADDWVFDYTHEHFIYLELPHPLQSNNTYTVELNAALNSDSLQAGLTFDIFHCRSEAVHVNLAGHIPGSRIKAADLYHFLGDGGNRDYSDFVGNAVYLYNVHTGESEQVGSVAFWMSSRNETHHNLTGSDVWAVDFTGWTQPGTFRLAVEGVGCSPDFDIRDDVYRVPYKLAVLGYFYMRIGQDNLDMTPVPRRPLYIQDQDPSNCKIYVTDMHPYHPEWNAFTHGDQWDRPEDWAPFKKAGDPTNPDAVGGHSDALDWDRHLGHVQNIYDLCLAYILSEGRLDDDDLRIAESGNTIPDILDEARNEVDFWLNLRYQGGYSHGLTNPDNSNRLYQAGNTAIAAWANALNSAMLAYCFQIAGLTDMKNAYQDSAAIAFQYADNLADPMLDENLEGIRGHDLKMTAAAYLYNLTGDTGYEDVVRSESMITGPNSAVHQPGSYNQLWGTAAYLLTHQSVHYPELQTDMKAAVITNAKSKESDKTAQRPSRRGRSDDQSYWQTNQDMHRTILAHAVSDNPADQIGFLDAMLLEAGWGLGRNPLNMIQMTTASTELADKRSVENCYTSGRNDGSPGLHPGHTPYLNIDGWGGVMVGSNPQDVLDRFYPDSHLWPHASKYINTRYIWAHSEFTPRQTMRGKALLYAYLYSLSKGGGAVTPVLIADAGKDQRLIDEDENGRETVRLDGSKSYSSQGHIVSYTWRLNGRNIAAGKFAAVELDTGRYSITLEVIDNNAASAVDTVKIIIVPETVDMGADFNFESADQITEWTVENWGDTGGTPLLFHSMEQAHTGLYSVNMEADFVPDAEHALRRNSPLDRDVIAITYYVWVPKNLVDAALDVRNSHAGGEGGVQNYLMHTDWNWISQWFALADLNGDAWNALILNIPEDVDPTSIQSMGVSFQTNGVDAGEDEVYIDDIIFTRDGSSAVHELAKDGEGIPTEFALYHNYPNPFNPSTMIPFDLPLQQRVKIEIFNLLGQKIQTLHNRTLSAGSHSVKFTAMDLSAGIYLYRMEAGEFQEIRKMSLLL